MPHEDLATRLVSWRECNQHPMLFSKTEMRSIPAPMPMVGILSLLVTSSAIF